MRVFRAIIEKYMKLQFKTRLTLSYILLIVMPLVVVGVGYYQKSSEIILENAKNNILNIVKKSNNTLNIRFSMAEESAKVMHIDDDLFEFFSKGNLSDMDYCISNDEEITKVILKYFPSSQDIYSVNIATKSFTFGENPAYWIPKNGFSNSRIYLQGSEAQESFKWISTYDLLEEFNIRVNEQLELKKYSQYIFSATRVLNLSKIKNNILLSMDKNIERPILIINFREEMLKKVFEENVSIQGSKYYILTRSAQVISSSDSNERISFSDTQWLSDAFEKGSGTNTLYIKGKKMLACFDTLDTTGWISVIFVPYESILQTLPSMYWYTLWFTLIITILSIIVASYISGRVTLPIKKLLYAIKNIGEGNFNSKIKEESNGELSYLIYKFNQMNDKIQKLIEENYQVKIKEKDAEIKALNFQFNPHFMYNTLNIINWTAIENDQEEISKMLINLSEMLEYTAKEDSSMVSFEKDMEYLKNYVYLMNKRFIGRFIVEFEIDSGLYYYKVPRFFIQPFVENSFIHGFDEMVEGGRLKISGWIENNIRYFSIEDNGKGMSDDKIKEVLKIEDESIETENKSIGIENVNKRIKLIYGKEYGISIKSEIKNGTKVTIVIPLEKI